MTAIAVCLSAVIVAGLLTSALLRRFDGLRVVVPWLVAVPTACVLVVALLDRPFGSGTDEVVYQRQARSIWTSLILTGRLDGDYVVVDQGKSGWPTMLGVLYRLTGDDNPYLGIVVNAVVAYVALLLVAAAGCRLWPGRTPGPWAGPVLTLSPTVLVFSASLLRETWVWLAVAVAVHGVISLTGHRRLVGAAVVMAGALLAYWVRAPMAAIIVGAVAAAVVVAWTWRRFGGLGGLTVFVALGLAGQRALVVALAYLGLTPDALLATRDYLAVSASTGFPPADPFTVPGLLQAVVRVGLGPLPWELRPSFVWVWILANWAFWILVLVLAAKALLRTPVTVGKVALMTFAFVLLVGLAISLTNYGIVVRMRAVVLVAVLPLAWGALTSPRATADASPERVQL